MKINPEFLPLIEWWEKDGKQTVIYLAIAAVAVGAWYGVKGYRAAQKLAAETSLVTSYTTDELENAVSKYGSSATGGALKIRLAKKYYDDGRYDEALSLYADLEKNAPEGFADIPVVGKAECLEAKGDYAGAQNIYMQFADSTTTNNYLLLTAKLGVARTIALQGDKDAALKNLAELKETVKDDMISKARVESLEDTVKRYEKPAIAPKAPEAQKSEAK